MITCGCNGKQYLFSESTETEHFKTKKHQVWIRLDSKNLYEQIIIDCPCGGNFHLFTQLKHLKSPEHQKWQSIRNNKEVMPFICQCSFIVPYQKLKEHRASDLHVIPEFDIERKSPWRLADR